MFYSLFLLNVDCSENLFVVQEVIDLALYNWITKYFIVEYLNIIYCFKHQMCIAIKQNWKIAQIIYFKINLKTKNNLLFSCIITKWKQAPKWWSWPGIQSSCLGLILKFYWEKQ
jgi:hypothetical protein